MAWAFFMESVADAAALAGGCDRLAEELGVSAAEVESWRAGTSIPDDAAFLRLIDFSFGNVYRTAKIQEKIDAPPMTAAK
jgi:hypothetical protein